MKRLRSMSFFPLALLLALGAPAGAANRVDENHVDGFAIQFASSQIEITKVYAFGVELEGHHVAVPETCVTYVNNGPKPVVHIQFDFAAVSSDGKIGIPEPYDTTGKFAVGVLQNSGYYNCRLSYIGQVLDGQLRDGRIFGRPEVLRLVAWVNKVVYADGTTWEAQPPTYDRRVPAADPPAGNGGSAQACADVDFVPVSRQRPGFAVLEHVKVTVRFADGHEEQAEYPYPWIYNEPLVSDPWLSPNDIPILQPTPPPDVPPATLPPLIRFLLAHADASGRLTLRPCTAKSRTVTLLERLDKGPLLTAVSVDRKSGIEAALRFARAYSDPIMVCAMVQNAGAKPVRRTVFLVTYRDATGKQLGVETLNVDIPIAPGGLVGTPPPFPPFSERDGCRVIGEGWSQPRRDQIANVLLTLRSVEYADGTVWPSTRSPGGIAP